MDKSLYYDPNKLLSFNRVLNFTIGARSIGKSYGWKKFVVQRFKKKGKKFIYLRRYKEELKNTVVTFFEDIKEEFPDDVLEVKGTKLFINGQLAGYGIPLSAWQSMKGVAYPDVETVLFDEFLREKGVNGFGYMPNEPRALLHFLHTVFRNRSDIRCICISNATTLVNPYFLYLKVVPDKNKRFNAYEEFVVEIPKSDKFKNEMKKTRFGKLIDGTEYEEMAINNEFTHDSSEFVEKRPKDSELVFCVVYEGMYIGIWLDKQRGFLFLSQNHDTTHKKIFALTSDDHKENNEYMKNWRDHFELHKLVRAFKAGHVRYENQIMRNLGYDIFKKMNIY